MEAGGVSKKNEQDILGGGDVEVIIEELDGGNNDNAKVSEPEVIEDNDQNVKEDDEKVDDIVEDIEENVGIESDNKADNEIENEDITRNEINEDDKVEDIETVDGVVDEIQNDDASENKDEEGSDKEEEKEVDDDEDTSKDIVHDAEDKEANTVDNDDNKENGIDVNQEIDNVESQENQNGEENNGNENGLGDKEDILKERDNEIDIQIIEKGDIPQVKDAPVVEKKQIEEVPEKHIPKADQKKDDNKENNGLPELNNNSVKNSISKFGAPVQRKEKGMFKVVQTEKCAACQKTVYAMEKLEMNGHIYHKNCFKCSHCSARLTPKTFSMNEGVIYCVNHFKQLFARKGNYDEGFGRQQYKKRWQGDKPEGATA